MQEFLLILKVIIILCGIVSFFSHQSEKARLKEQRARLFSARRGTDLSEEERSAISELWELDVTSSEVYCIDERLEVHAIPSENDKDEEMGYFALAEYPILMGDKAIEYIDEERVNAEVVLHDDMLIVITLKDYNIVDCVNNTLPEAPNNALSDDCLQNTENSEQACLDQPATIAEDNTPIEQEDVPAVFKYDRPVTLLEARYLQLSSPFYNILVPTLLLLAIGIFLYVTDIGLSLEPGWLSAVILAVVCCATLFLLTMEGPKPATENLVVKRYFGQIKTMRMIDNKIWIVFIAPNGEVNEAWIPDEWQNAVNLGCDVQFEIEQSQSAVMSIGLNAISEQDTVKKKPRYIVAAIGLLFGIFFIAFNTHWEWREASLAILNNNSSYQINSTADWPTNGFKAGDNLSITQPRLCLDSRYENNRLVYCKQFEYPLVGDDFKVTPDEAVIKAYIHFISEAPDFAPEMPQDIYDYAARIVKIRNSLGLNYEYGSFGTHRIRSRSEMAMFTVESLQLIANHITPYCSTDNQAKETDRAENLSVDEPQLNQACNKFKQQFAELWEELTSSSCEVSACWDEALKAGELDDGYTVRNDEDAYFSSLRRLKQEIWQATKASLTLSSPEQPSITIDWSGAKSEELLKIARLRSKLDRSNQEERITYLNELLLLQSEASQQRVEGTILRVSNNDGHLTLTVIEKISPKQALSTIMNSILIAFFGLLMTLLFIAFFRSGRPRKEKQAKSKDAWIS
ncbi:hypothetical protein BS333_04395 [Vibrio azureus]|uniref:Intracellular growth attenuator protein IgaA n=1 Tax=Vibrio azureus NBRC 104587 TaxID=1219077 RepID=U3C3B3_9VIBR|nr:hypothetical protein [Vibrio azureus]AUI85675.1 hypothetical protein BS333_04395 [Vibrio azureus]GAD75919.1 hypothetical protein VAZ01S_032_00630 [Vibrio azureus NBRC 104587]